VKHSLGHNRRSIGFPGAADRQYAERLRHGIERKREIVGNPNQGVYPVLFQVAERSAVFFLFAGRFGFSAALEFFFFAALFIAPAAADVFLAISSSSFLNDEHSCLTIGSIAPPQSGHSVSTFVMIAQCEYESFIFTPDV
jgi:hypothetical protein